MGIPIPQRKPDFSKSVSNNSDGSILSSLFDLGSNAFKTLSQIELERYEAKRLADVRAAEQAVRVEKDETFAGKTTAFIAKADDPAVKNTAFLIGGGMIFVAVILLIKGK